MKKLMVTAWRARGKLAADLQAKRARNCPAKLEVGGALKRRSRALGHGSLRQEASRHCQASVRPFALPNDGSSPVGDTGERTRNPTPNARASPLST